MSIERTQRLPSVSAVQPRENPIDISLKAHKPSVKQPPVSATQVQLSDAQAHLMQPGSQDIDMNRVETIKQAIRQGELQMDTGRIADALLQETQRDTQWLSAATDSSVKSCKG
ncbi:flagellar biosynthesis anti-sigma factor FlgM [Enterobacteriaceae bacterium ESL0689]|nr:flagellar biosynthesis anti-sigma factor FlgM [Enterobacteriaceae bacterium ESL0689]